MECHGTTLVPQHAIPGNVMKQEIKAFHKDDQGNWVADLACGHSRHVRHDPPWQSRPWVETEEGRAMKVGFPLECQKCDEVNASEK